MKGRALNMSSLFRYGMKNSGNVANKASDSEGPVVVQFGAVARVLSVEVEMQKPSDLGAELVARDSALYIRPALLNPGDFMLFNALVSNASPESGPVSRVRVEGIAKPSRRD